MPKLSVISIKAAMLYLLIGITFGALLLSSKVIPIHPAVWALLPLHIETLLVGWIISLIFGVAYWILPRFPGNDRGRVGLARIAIVTLNAGILVVLLSSILRIPELIPSGRVLEFGAVLVYSIYIVDRVRPTRGYKRRI